VELNSNGFPINMQKDFYTENLSVILIFMCISTLNGHQTGLNYISKKERIRSEFLVTMTSFLEGRSCSLNTAQRPTIQRPSEQKELGIEQLLGLHETN
jgi:hypothetical protein